MIKFRKLVNFIQGGCIRVDSFMDKLAQRFNSQEIIKANAQAEAAEIERMKKQMEQYDVCLQDMRKLSLSNTEAAEKMKELIDNLETSRETLMEQIKNMNADAYECVHKENVKVYRNVQAVVQEESAAVKDAVKAVKKSVNGKFVVGLVFAILAFVCAAADLAFDLLVYFHIL